MMLAKRKHAFAIDDDRLDVLEGVIARAVRRLDRVARLEGMVADVVRRLDALEGLKRRKTPDPEGDDRLLGAIAGYAGGAVFAAADLLAAHDVELVAALDGMNGREIGAWLKRARRRSTGPYRVERVGRDGSGAMWRLYQA